MKETTTTTIENTSTIADRVAIVYYTDPLCCWSWAMEHGWQQLKETLAPDLSVRYCMGGMIPDWNSYHDTINSISRPVQMGPLWMEVHHRTGATLFDRIWMQDPPASSYPSCIAVKAAGLQGLHFEESMLRLLREAVMVHGKNIAKTAVLLEAAERMPASFNAAQFHQDLVGQAAIEAFRKDLEEIRLQEVTRFPSMKMSGKGRAIMMTGYRRGEVLLEAAQQL